MRDKKLESPILFRKILVTSTNLDDNQIGSHSFNYLAKYFSFQVIFVNPASLIIEENLENKKM